MDGQWLARMGARQRNLVELIATGEIDDFYEEFEGTTYRSPSGVDFTGVEAAEHWTDAFGITVTRTTGVFALDEGAAGFVAERREPDLGPSTAYAVEVEVSCGHITSMTESRPEP